MPLPKPPAQRASRLEASDYSVTLTPSKTTARPATPASVAPAAAPVAAPTAEVLRLPTPSAPPAAGKQGAAGRSAAKAPATAPKRSRSKAAGAPKLFVLDTNVLMHDPMSLFRFEEHDIFLPMITLEELDGHKKGMTEVARNVRQVSRELDQLAASLKSSGIEEMAKGLSLASTGHREAEGKLFFQTELIDAPLPQGLPQGKADNQILGVVQALKERHTGREVVLVSKDINMRIKARALGLPAEDYRNDKTLEDSDLLYTGVQGLPSDFWERHGKTMESWQQGGTTFYRISGPLVPTLLINELVYLEAPGATPLYAKVTEITGKTAVLRTLKDYAHQKHAVWGVTARNREQNFALNLLMDPECDFITLTGTAGTGKTLMTLAAALSQVFDDRRYSEIIVTRVTVPVGEDIGFLPGTEEEKMGPWMGALDDNLEVLAKGGSTAGEWGRAATNDLVRSKIKIKSLNFMRGRTFLNKFVIIDEAQNLTPKQMKTLITRAGPGTKIVCLGNLAQIDTPYLTEGSSGLTFAVDRFKGWAHSGHVTLARGERSRLADFASEVL
ncbi:MULTISPECIES: PhoH family protein [unclassified Roseateles]|uniref:PhoH family protein n=1 Tax=unclassified Roseateles TaxID=2626991 RepID=UPI00070179E2|nr:MULTISPECIES: PhoH family protein [unclassified Roseateles]KQW44641.1 phosphate starvation-inducible protein PhoH [Pelomonas sp. Root405]KRA70000.1 phosphate starvation-inducible protein PhoH [Pelomonas sp. Root662]